MLQASLPECSQEAYRGFTGSQITFVNIPFTNHVHVVVSQFTIVTSFVVSQGCGKGTDGGAVERRLKKSNDFTLGQVSF